MYTTKVDTPYGFSLGLIRTEGTSVVHRIFLSPHEGKSEGERQEGEFT